MPVIPTFGSRVPIESAPLRGVNPAAMAAGGEALAAAGARTAAIFGELAERTAEANRANQVSAGMSGLTEQLLEARSETELGVLQPDGTRLALPPGDMVSHFDRRREEITQGIANGITDRGARAIFMARARDRQSEMRFQIQQSAARRTSEVGIAALDQEEETYAQQTAAARDPIERARAVSSYTEAVGARVATNVIDAADGQRRIRRFRDRVTRAEVIRDINTSPETALRRLSAGEYRLSDPVAVETLAGQARTAIQTRVAQADTALRRQEHQARIRANDAEKAFTDAQRAGNREAMEQALQVLRRDGQAGQYASAADSLYGRLEPPTTPQMEAWLETRMRARDQVLTRDELERARAARSINDTVYRRGLASLSAREDVRFREAEAFVDRALEVPSASIPDRDLRPAQREATRQRNAIVNDLVLERQRNPDVNPLEFVRERLERAPDAGRVVRQQAAETALNRMAPEVRTPEGLAQIEQAWAAHQAAIANRGWFGSTPPVPRLSNGARVTAEDLARWRLLHEQAGLREPAGGATR